MPFNTALDWHSKNKDTPLAKASAGRSTDITTTYTPTAS